MGGGGGRSAAAIGMAVIAMLAGCAHPQPIASLPLTSAPLSSASGEAAAAAIAATGLPTKPELPRSEVASLTAAPIERQPVRLVGMSPGEIERLLGHPRFVRHEGHAQIWRFPNHSCILDVFFYREATGFTVRHYDPPAPALGA